MDNPIIVNQRARITDGVLEGKTGTVIRYSYMDNIVEIVLDCDYDTAVIVPSELVEHITDEKPVPTATPHILEITGNNALGSRREQHFERFDSQDDAIDFFKRAIVDHPSLFDFALYEVKKSAALPLHLKRQAEQKKTEEMTRQLQRNMFERYEQEREENRS